jgi:ATP-binding cassette subfamily B protein
MSELAEDTAAATYDGALLRRLLRYLRPYWWQAALAMLLLLASAAIALVDPILTQRALDVAIPRRDMGHLLTLALVALAALVAEFVLAYAQGVVTSWIGQRVMRDIRLEIFGHLQRLGIPYFDRNPVGRLMTRVTSDVETLNELFSSGVVTLFGDVFTLIAIMALMLVTDWQLALVAFAVMPLMWLTARVFRHQVRSAFVAIRVRLARLNSYLQERLTGVRVVQLFGREEPTAAEFGAINADHLEAHLRSVTIYALFFPVVEILTSVALALLLWYGGLRSLGGTLTIGVLAAFIQLTRRFFQPLQDLSEKFNLLQSAMASSERIFALLDEPAAQDSGGEQRPVPAAEGSGREKPPTQAADTSGRIAFENVWFRYSETGPWVLRDVSFVAGLGETVALVGHTGAGKTTIISLLLRFYEPTQGRITIDGQDIREMSVSELRGLMGYVQQDLFLFAGDILTNLRLDAPVDEAVVRRAAERVGADRFIRRLPEGYHHLLGERGRSLSVGERQLLSFARALVRDPRILVLDEATSSVDAEAEAQIQRAVAELMVGRTSLVVAHRLSTILHADQILVLHHGEVRERGTHRALLEAGGHYARLHAVQFGAGAERRTA